MTVKIMSTDQQNPNLSGFFNLSDNVSVSNEYLERTTRKLGRQQRGRPDTHARSTEDIAKKNARCYEVNPKGDINFW